MRWRSYAHAPQQHSPLAVMDLQMQHVPRRQPPHILSRPHASPPPSSSSSLLPSPSSFPPRFAASSPASSCILPRVDNQTIANTLGARSLLPSKLSASPLLASSSHSVPRSPRNARSTPIGPSSRKSHTRLKYKLSSPPLARPFGSKSSIQCPKEMPASTHTPSSGHLHSCSSSFPPSLSLHSSTFPGFKQHTPDLGVKSGSFLFLRDDSDLDVQLDKASASRDLLAYQNHALMVEKTQLIEVNTRLITEHVEDQQRIEDLEKQRAQWKTENHELSDEGEELKKCNMSLEGEKERLQSELSRLQSSQQHFSDLSAKLEADCTASKLEIKKLTSDHNATFFQNQQLKKKNHILDQNCVRLRAELEAMEQKAAILLSKHTQETDKAKEDIRYLHSTNTRLQSQHKDAVLSHQNCYKLHVQLRKLQAHIQAKEAEASQLKQEGKESRDDLAHALDKLKWRQDQWDEKHSAFQERVTDLMYEVSVARSAHADCDDKICRLEGQLKARQIELKSKASLLGTKSEQLLRLQGLYDTLIQDYENVTDKYTHLRHANAEFTEERQRLMKLQVKSTKTEQTLQLEVEKNNALQTELQASSEIQTMCNEKEAALRKELEILSAKHAKCDRKISHLRTSLTRSGAVHSRCEAKISGLEEELRLSKDNARAEKTKMLSELHKMRRTQNLFGRAQEEERQAQEDRLRAEVEEHIKEAQSSASKWEIKFSESQKQVGLLQEKLKQQQLDFVNDGNKAAVMWEERAIDRQIKNRDLRKENQDMVRVIGKLQRRIHALVDASSDQGKGNTRGSATIRTQGAQPPVAYESSLFDLATHMSDINKQMK